VPEPELAEWERVFAAVLLSADPLARRDALLADQELAPTTREQLVSLDADGLQLSAMLVAKLRFERLMQGSDSARTWFERDPREFTAAFRRYHHSSAPRARFPSEEALEFDAWRGE
jgi:hypothetical protein